ncbi:MAG: dockerin type I repeat-containing protein, partial [Deltaproteobacteria bacterium]|nr:dockerin type I repeat-containing protein [Deltaproteobacteria bacterium]
AQINDALDKLQGVGAYQGQGGVDCKVILILESCYSGNFIQDLSGPDRVIVTSAGSEAYKTDSAGRISFSRYLFSKLREGDNLKKAFDSARSSLVNMGYPSPQLDDNGNGVADANDGLLASNLYLNGLLTWGLKPAIAEISLVRFLEEGPSTPISVKVIQGDVPIARVWVQVIAPDADITGGDQTITYPEIDITYNATTGKYEGTITGLTLAGVYKIVVFAEDEEHQVSDPSIAYVSIAEAIKPGDVNGDGKITLADAILAIKVACRMGVSSGDINVTADVNGDYRIGIAEAIYIMREMAK